ncbi:SDR family oxidoreductase [Promicromonospora sp. NPDC023805]|uniref:SDR family NAD(P)-dependent oxidoreductase n=1 Tax=Promicromonospora sp. NPDC023805 TaxID=3154696 RepID=UPI0033D5206D
MERSALVTGGTGSIGSSIVRALTQNNISVVFQYHSDSQRAAEISRETGATSIQIDLRTGVIPDFPDVDILVNSAGVLLTKTSVEEVGDAEIEQTLAVNLVAPFHLIRRVVPGMKARRWGRIVNIGSIYAHRGTSNNSTYNVSKHALLGLTRSAAKDLASFGITVNQVDPSAVDSDIIDDLARRYAASGATTFEAYKQDLASGIPVGRLADAKEIASAVAYLVSEEAGFITGEALVVDGGLIA